MACVQLEETSFSKLFFSLLSETLKRPYFTEAVDSPKTSQLISGLETVSKATPEPQEVQGNGSHPTLPHLDQDSNAEDINPHTVSDLPGTSSVPSSPHSLSPYVPLDTTQLHTVLSSPQLHSDSSDVRRVKCFNIFGMRKSWIDLSSSDRVSDIVSKLLAVFHSSCTLTTARAIALSYMHKVTTDMITVTDDNEEAGKHIFENAATLIVKISC
jgi:hypothetical protein